MPNVVLMPKVLCPKRCERNLLLTHYMRVLRAATRGRERKPSYQQRHIHLAKARKQTLGHYVLRACCVTYIHG